MKFHKGEIAVLVASIIPNDPDVGRECEIIELPRSEEWLFEGKIAAANAYLIKTPTGIFTVSERHLRKRQPPAEPLMLWLHSQIDKWVKQGEPA